MAWKRLFCLRHDYVLDRIANLGIGEHQYFGHCHKCGKKVSLWMDDTMCEVELIRHGENCDITDEMIYTWPTA